MIKEDFAFAIPILKLKVSDWENKKPKLLDAVNWENEHCYTQHYFSDFFANMECEEHPYLLLFDFLLNDEINKVEKHIGRGLQITELWAQRYAETQAMPTHNHGAHGFSAIVYAEYDEEVHTPTVFYSPFGNFLDGQITVYEPEVTEGDMVVFPSMLLHSSMPFIANKNRTIFSFNMRLL